MALTNTYVQTIAPDRLRGRIASLYTLHAGGIMAFSNLGYGFMADVFSAPQVLLVTAVVFVALLAALSAGQRSSGGSIGPARWWRREPEDRKTAESGEGAEVLAFELSVSPRSPR